jgi:predicted nuclease of predicted toxin-antitoxin system
LKLLLDSHVKRAVVDALRVRAPGVEVVHLADWRQGALREAADADILAACQEEGRVWLTYDQQTVPDLLREWADAERPHAGVIFADRNSVPPNHAGAVAAAIARLATEVGEVDTTNLVRYLSREGSHAG